MPRVLIAPVTLAGVQGSYLDLLSQAGFEPVYPPKPGLLTEAQLMELWRGVEASLAGSEPYNSSVLAAYPRLKVIARVGVGFDAVDLVAATQQGVAVTITPGTNQDAVAEHTFAMILALAKNLL